LLELGILLTRLTSKDYLEESYFSSSQMKGGRWLYDKLSSSERPGDNRIRIQLFVQHPAGLEGPFAGGRHPKTTPGRI